MELLLGKQFSGGLMSGEPVPVEKIWGSTVKAGR